MIRSTHGCTRRVYLFYVPFVCLSRDDLTNRGKSWRSTLKHVFQQRHSARHVSFFFPPPLFLSSFSSSSSFVSPFLLLSFFFLSLLLLVYLEAADALENSCDEPRHRNRDAAREDVQSTVLLGNRENSGNARIDGSFNWSRRKKKKGWNVFVFFIRFLTVLDRFHVDFFLNVFEFLDSWEWQSVLEDRSVRINGFFFLVDRENMDCRGNKDFWFFLWLLEIKLSHSFFRIYYFE